VMKNLSEKPAVILLGSSGFLGSQLFVELVRQGYDPKRADSDLFYLERNHSRSKFDLSKTIVISMAWSSNSKSNYMHDPENLVWAKKHIEIAKFCLKNDYFLVVPGSCLEYGENESINYVKSKMWLRKFLEENFPNDKYLWIRYFYVFSLAHRRPGLIRDALQAKDHSKPFYFGNAEGHHDFIEVRDAIGQTVELINQLNFGVWDIGTGRTRSNLEILSKIRNLNIVRAEGAEGSNKTRVSWEGSAKKLIPNFTEFTTHTNEFFGTL